MTVEDTLTDSVYTFELQEELVRSGDCDSWKEIAVRVDTTLLQLTTATAQKMTDSDGHKLNDDVSDATAAAEPAQSPQLLGNCPRQ